LKPTSTIQTDFKDIQSRLIKLLRAVPSQAARIGEIMELLEALERKTAALPIAPAASLDRLSVRTSRRYKIEFGGIPSESVLAEFRPNADSPLRCERKIYDAVARALAKADRPLKFPTLMKAVAKEPQRARANYQVRVALRFWGDPDVSLTERVRTRYVAKNQGTFVQDAEQAWQKLAALSRATGRSGDA
jgi:hypothetical protein